MCLKNKFTRQVEKEFSTSTFCGIISSIDVYMNLDYYNHYNIIIKCRMEFEFMNKCNIPMIVGIDKIYRKEELENNNLRSHIIDALDYELQAHVKKVKIEMFKQYPDLVSVTFKKILKSS